MQTTNIACPISISEELIEDIKKENWHNPAGQKLVINGVELMVKRLQKHGFIKLDTNELAVEPLPVFKEEE